MVAGILAQTEREALNHSAEDYEYTFRGYGRLLFVRATWDCEEALRFLLLEFILIRPRQVCKLLSGVFFMDAPKIV